MDCGRSYHSPEPAFLTEFSQVPELLRLKQVGMNCGCEYTSFPLFRELRSYSRYQHSVGAARIVWDFTGDMAQTVAALFHDIATPAFAHSVDFLHGDHLRQESTEALTGQMILSSLQIAALLDRWGLSAEQVVDYHLYPIADNNPPRLSADRLEYTLGNLENFGIRTPETLNRYYQDLTVTENESGEPELAFSDASVALAFGLDALRCSRIYVSDEDRYAMQMLAELLGRAIHRGVLTEAEMYGTEPAVISALRKDEASAADWNAFRALHEIVREEDLAPPALRRVIPAKKRCIDPLIRGAGRLSDLDRIFSEELDRFLTESQTDWICGR